MLAWTVSEFGPYREVLRLVERPRLPLDSGSVRVRMHSAGINFPDLLLIAGKYQVRPPLPFTPGFEGVGEVVEAANGGGCQVGERVLCQRIGGTFGEYLDLPSTHVLAAPEEMTDSEAAGFLIPYQTAWFALEDRARLQPGEVLLVHGAAGGVGTACVELGRAAGATVVATAGDGEKRRLCRDLGAHHVLDSRSEDWVAQVREITDGRGADVIVDLVGGDLFDRSLRCLAWGGRILPVGFAGGRIPTIAANRILLKHISVVGLHWTTCFDHAPERIREAHARLVELYRGGKIRPRIYRDFAMADLPRALDALAERRCRGKAVLYIAGSDRADQGEPS